MPAPEKNQFAAKPADEVAEAHLHIRVRSADKSAWVRAAAARVARDGEVKTGLAAWVIDTLNAAAAEAEAKKKK